MATKKSPDSGKTTMRIAGLYANLSEMDVIDRRDLGIKDGAIVCLPIESEDECIGAVVQGTSKYRPSAISTYLSIFGGSLFDLTLTKRNDHQKQRHWPVSPFVNVNTLNSTYTTKENWLGYIDGNDLPFDIVKLVTTYGAVNVKARIMHHHDAGYILVILFDKSMTKTIEFVVDEWQAVYIDHINKLGEQNSVQLMIIGNEVYHTGYKIGEISEDALTEEERADIITGRTVALSDLYLKHDPKNKNNISCDITLQKLPELIS